MADKAAQLEAHKAAASNFRSQIDTAATKDEALNLAISVAEKLMQALKLSSNPEERKQLKAQCGEMMNVADQIKKTETWIPAKSQSAAKPSNAIHPDDAPIMSVKSSPRPQLSSTISQSTSSNAGEAASSSAATSRSQIYRLREPISSRQLSKKEEIILLKASVVNGFKCPPWTKDPSAQEFAPNENGGSFTDVGRLSLSPYQQQFFQAWLRAKEAVPPPSYPPDSRADAGPSMSSSKPLDLVQDAASDCSVVTSLCAAIARSERGHEQRGTPVTSSNGKYIVRLNFNGCWRKVVIDDELPVSNTHRILHVIDRRNPALLWPALLEKAYLKVRGGYDFPGSNSCGDLWALTGWIPEQVFLQETDTVPGQLWKRIYNAFMYGDVLVTAGTGKMSSKQEREFGLEGQHSYVVLDMKELDHDRLLLIKNPWVEGKGWRGPRPPAVAGMDSSAADQDSDDSLASYHRDSIPTQDRPHPTTFWMGLEQVIQHFDSLYLNWNPGLFRCRQDIHFEWDVTASSPGGCIVKHPQFAFTCKETGPVWFLLNRHFRDVEESSKEESDVFNDGTIRPDTQSNSNGDAPKGYMSIYICTGNGERLYMKDTYLESSDYVTTPQCLLRADMDAKTTYTVVIDQDDLPPSKYTFTLSAFANTPLTLEPATQRLPLQEIQEGAWTRQTAGGGTDSPKYFDNPQYLLHIHERSSLAILLTSSNHEHPLHVKLAFGHGKRLYRLSSRDVVADSGNHRSGCVLAEVKDLQPGYYTIICSLFEAGLTGDYTLRVDSSSQVKLTAIPRDGAGLLSMKLAPACFGAHVHKVAAPLHACRLASYTIIARFLRATSPRAMDLGKLARSPLRLSVELGRGPERIFLVTSEQGEYADSATVRSESFNIDPKDVRPGEVWLVLDRLSGPRGPVEEWYDVEIYTDTPKACEIGVWRDWDD